MNEDEDMSGKSDAGDIYLRITVREPVGGSCSTAGTALDTETDSSYDLKHFAAVEDSTQNLEGECLEVELNKTHVAASMQTHVFCYYAGRLDDAPN